MVDEQVERLGGQLYRLAHARKTGLAMEGDNPGSAAGLGLCVDVGNHSRVGLSGNDLRNSLQTALLEGIGRLQLLQTGAWPLVFARLAGM